MRSRVFVAITGAASMLALAGCATSADEIAEGDPLEGVNRGVHGFNEAVAQHVVAPVANAAKSNTSESGRSGTGQVLHHVGNMLNNLGEPKNALNGVLQADPGAVGTAVARFGLNSTVGLLGMYDAAGNIGLQEQEEDFGQTLGAWGAPPGPYVVAPLAGPTTTRDVAGTVVDSMLNPAGMIPIPGEAMTMASTTVAAGRTLDSAEATAEAARTEEDSYAAARARYEDRRAAQIANVSPPRPMAPIEHREDVPQPPAGALAAAPGSAIPATIVSSPRIGSEALGSAPALRDDEPEQIAPGQPLVIDVYPAAPARERTPQPARYAD